MSPASPSRSQKCSTKLQECPFKSMHAIPLIKLFNLATTQSSCSFEQILPVHHYVNNAVQTLPGPEPLLLPFTRPLGRIFTSLHGEPEECLPCQIPQCCLLGFTVLATQATKYQSEQSLTGDPHTAERSDVVKLW